MSSSSDFSPLVNGAATVPSSAPEVRRARIGQNLATPPLSPERARENAEAQGFSVGWAAGHRAAAAAVAEQTAQLMAQEQAWHAAYSARLDSALSALERAGAELQRRMAPHVEDAADLIAHAAYVVAESIVGRELTSATDAGLDAVRRALVTAPRSSAATVFLNPDDAAALREVSSDGPVFEGRDITLVADPGLRSGDAVAEVDSTTLDARILPALARVKEILSP